MFLSSPDMTRFSLSERDVVQDSLRRLCPAPFSLQTCTTAERPSRWSSLRPSPAPTVAGWATRRCPCRSTWLRTTPRPPQKWYVPVSVTHTLAGSAKCTASLSPPPQICPICAALPGGDPNHVTDDFAAHLTLEHRAPRDLISFSQ